jgi:hypothetical protein
MTRHPVLVVAFALGASLPAHAQQAPLWSLDASLGAAGSFTKGYVYDDAIAGISADLTFALRFPNIPLVVAANATANGPIAGSDVCYFSPRGGCMPRHPEFAFLGALAGWESARARVRALGGPAYALARWEHPAFAIQSRVDVALPIVRHLALIGSLRAMLVPNYDHASYNVPSAGIGLRVRGR